MARKPVNITPLEQRVYDFIRENRLVTRGQILLVAVSGGHDSVCLLHILAGLQCKLGIKLHAAHLDHQLRGKESTGDAEYVSALAKQLGIPCTVKKGNVRAYQKAHAVSLEEAAREVRYDFLAETAAAIGTNRVAVGHTLDDHVETILLHLVRGTGTRGLRGLQPVTLKQSPARELTVVRPLMAVRRDDTAAYCIEHKLQPRQDSTNLSLEPLRNRVRLELLPLLQSYNPQVKEALQRTAQIAGDDIDYLEKNAAHLYQKLAVRQLENILLDKKSLLKQPISMRRYILRLAIENAAGNLKDIEARHIEELVTALEKPAGKQIHLPYGLIFTVDYDRYTLGKDNAALIPFPVLEGEYSIKTPGTTNIPGWQIKAAVIKPGSPTGGNNNFLAHFDRAKIVGALTLRTRKHGDRFQPLGMPEMKKIGQFMLDAKIPRDWRDRIPLVVSGESIVWVTGYRIDERFKVTAGTEKILYLEFTRI
jgi:tRNA(Ile)-lysidine synthase